MANSTIDNSSSNNTSTESDDSSGMSVSRIATWAAGITIAIILGLLIFALIVSVTASETWSPVIQIFRDILVVLFVVEGILVVGAIAILTIQIARFFVLLQVEIKPILDNARETTKATKATAQFVSKNAADPLIQIKSFFAGFGTFIREILRIRRLIKPNKSSTSGADDDKS